MNYYTVPRVGDGLTPTTAYRPDVQDLNRCRWYVGATDCLVGTPDTLLVPPATPVVDLEAECEARGLDYAVVLSWRVE